MFVNILLNAFHGLVMAWADFPRSIDAVKMAEIHGLITAEAGITDLGIIAFVKSNDLRWMIHNGIMVVIIPIFYAVIVVWIFICDIFIYFLKIFIHFSLIFLN
jgi:uncharacterized membrane protein YdbT with pleckstrin-like domain